MDYWFHFDIQIDHQDCHWRLHVKIVHKVFLFLCWKKATEILENWSYIFQQDYNLCNYVALGNKRIQHPQQCDSLEFILIFICLEWWRAQEQLLVHIYHINGHMVHKYLNTLRLIVPFLFPRHEGIKWKKWLRCT